MMRIEHNIHETTTHIQMSSFAVARFEFVLKVLDVAVLMILRVLTAVLI